ncbi:Occlusion-derived virus envelope protein E66 [Formica fusca]
MMESMVAKSTSNEPKNLDQYTIGGANTGIYTKWDIDNKELGDMCNWLKGCVYFYLRKENSMERRKKCIDIMDDFVPRYQKAMEGKYNKTFPWGKNWYQFSISSTLMLFHYMLIAGEKGQKIAIDMIRSIIVTPKKSLGQTRSEANSVYMALPWIVAHYYNKTIERASQDPDYVYVVNYIKLQPTKEKKEVGLYRDYTYITHGNCLAYGYLSEMINMSLPLVYFDNCMTDFLSKWEKCQKILAHPTIPYGPVGFYTRSSTLKSFSYKDSKLGIEVIPTCLFIRMYGDDYSFAVRGQNSWIAYYESDKTNDDMAQYWVQYRNVHFAKQEYKPTFPDVGFFYEKYAEDNPHEPVKERCRIRTCTSTTTTFCTELNRCQLVNAGFVFSYANIGMMRHFYNCAEMRYTSNPNSERGRFSVDEYIFCDYNNHTIDIWIRIYRHTDNDVIIFVEREHLWAQGDHNIYIYHLRWDCKNCTLTFCDRQAVQCPADEWDVCYPKDIEVVNTDNTIMLLDHGEPKLAMYPDSFKELNSNFKTIYQDKEYEFVFDDQTNQYWLAGLCIDK